MAFAYTKLMQAMVAAGVVTDPYFNLVTLLLPGNGTNGAQNNTFLDSSSNNFTITRNGNTTQGTFSPFSQTGWSNFFDGSDDGFSYSGTTFGSGAWTIELWFYFTGSSFTGTIQLMEGTTDSLALAITSATSIRVDEVNVSNDAYTVPTMSTNTWYHLVAVKDGSGNQTLFLNGTRSSTGVTTTVRDFTSATVRIANSTIGATDYTGYISNLRIVTGSAVYSPSASTITVPTAPLTAISGTQLLTCQSNRFIDNSSNAYALTISSTPSVQAFSPFLPTAAYSASTNGGSGYFDGTGDYLTVANNTALQVGSGDFTIEGWYYPTNSPSQADIFTKYSAGSQEWGVIDSSSSLGFYAGTGGASWTLSPLTFGTVKVNQWNHFAVCRSGNTFSTFLNGTRGATTTNSFTIGATTISVGIGSGNGFSGSFVNGYVSNYRIVKGTAVYDVSQTSITVPTAPFTNITNTSLLCNFTNGGITDATAKNDLETVGNVSISTTQSKFGGSSMYFDGTGYLKPSGNQQLYRFRTGDFTVEMWVYLTSYGTNTRLYDGRPAANGPYLAIQVNTGGFSGTSNALQVYVSSAVRIDAGVAVTLNSWFHLAVCRSGNSTKMFVDGTQSGSTYTDSTDYSGGNAVPTIGASEDGNNKMSGYLDDLRITNGFARYTANFTPTTTTFPLQ